MNPFYTAYETSLSKLNDHDWNVLRSHYHMFSGFSFVRKIGRGWHVSGFGISGPLFKTKRAAEEYVSNLIMAESKWRAHQAWEAEHRKAA